MMKAKTWKSVGALLLTVAMLAGMLAVVGVIPGAAKTTDAMKFRADFSELAAFVNSDENAGFTEDGTYAVTYTSAADTVSTDGKINAWMAERFDIYNTRQYALRSWMGQSSASLQRNSDTWTGNTYFMVQRDGALYYQSGTSDQMLRKPDMLVVQYKGENAILRNFEAELVFTRYSANTSRSAVIIDFHETEPGAVKQQENDSNLVKEHSGNTVVLGNGAGDQVVAGNDGLVFWKQGVVMSQTTIDEQTRTEESNETKGDGERFTNPLTSSAWYTLKVRVVNGAVTITVLNPDGTTLYTVDKNCDTAEGYLSFGFSNAVFGAKSFTVTELDDKGNQVDFGTRTAAETNGVEVFNFDFSQQLPDACWNGARYQYDPEHNAEVFESDETHVLATEPVNTEGEPYYYPINTRDTALVELLESKFDFFYFQESNVFERPNVNGYATDADGNVLTAKASAPAKAPDSGNTVGSYVDGVGLQGNSPNGIAQISLSAGKWIGSNEDFTGQGNTAQSCRKGFAMRVQDADGNPAVLRNFKLEMDVLLEDWRSQEGDFSTLAVSFRTTDPLHRDGTTGAAFLLSPYGGYFVGDDYTITNGVIFNKNNAGTSTIGNTYYDTYTSDTGVVVTGNNNQAATNGVTGIKAAVYQGAAEAKLDYATHKVIITVVGNTVNAVVTNEDGTETYLNVSDTNILDTYGYLYIGNILNGAKIGSVKVTRLSDDSTMENLIPVDFNEENAGNTFSATFTGALERRTTNTSWDDSSPSYPDAYYVNNGKKAAFDAVNNKVTNWLELVEMPYAFGDSAFATALSNKFNFYLSNTGVRTTLATPYDDCNGTARWKLSDEKTLSAVYTKDSASLFSQAMTMVPKIGDKEIVAIDFETEFDINLQTDTPQAAVALGFCSQKPGSWSTAEETVQGDRGMVVLSASGVFIAENKEKLLELSPDGSTADIYASPFDADTTATGASKWKDDATVTDAHVFVKLFKQELTVKVTSLNGASVYYENTVTLSDNAAAGALEYTVLGGTGGISNIRLNVLNEDGDPVSSEATMQEMGQERVPIVDVAKDLVDGSIELLGRVESDKPGYYKFLVKAVPDVDCQLQIGSITATNGAEVSLLREYFQNKENLDSNTFAIYTQNDTVVSATFITPHTVGELDCAVIGTQKQEIAGRLRFISRLAVKHDEDRNAYVMVDGKKQKVTDYGALVALKAVLGNDPLELTTCESNKYVIQKSAKASGTYYDFSDDYIDISVRITGFTNSAYWSLPIVSRGYLVLEDGSVIYTDVAETTFANA